MAMLAEPRRKQKVINLRAKNNAWSNDTNKFGQRMLEKMGWSSGKGLGAKENGIVEHVVARYKNDDRGLGFEDRNDQWTKHEDDFNALLSNLSNAGDNEDKLHSGISLEDKSKKSKARIHYHKYTRGKDLSRYSEKDLANIFGKKSLKEDKKKKEKLNADIKTTEQVFMEGGSMDDYFKKKMASKTHVSPQTKEDDNIESDFVFKGFSNDDNNEDEVQNPHSGFGFQSFSFYNTAESNETQQDSESKDKLIESVNKKSKKKKSKEQNHIQNESDVIQSDSNMHDTEVKCSKKSKKSKKKKIVEIIDQDEIDTVPRKKSKNKNKVECYQENEEVHENEDSEVHVPKKKKKRKNKD